MIGIAFDVDYLWNNVLRSIAYGVNDHAATHRAIWTRTTSLASTIDFQPLCLRIDRFQIEASGRVEDIDVLKDAVAAIDEDDLEDLAD